MTKKLSPAILAMTAMALVRGGEEIEGLQRSSLKFCTDGGAPEPRVSEEDIARTKAELKARRAANWEKQKKKKKGKVLIEWDSLSGL